MDEITRNKASKGPNSPYVKESLAAIKSPRSRSAPQTPSGECRNQVIHGCLDASSGQLGDKIFEMERRRSTSNGEESRIGSDNDGNTKPQKDGKSLKSPGSNSFNSLKKSRRPSPLRSLSDSPAISSLKMSSRGLSNPEKHSDKSEEPSEAGIDNPDLGPFLLNRARDLISSGDNLRKALKYALRAVKSFEKCTSEKPNLDLVMCLHVIASIHCKLGEFGEAVPVLERSIEIPAPDGGHDHALALFSGYMQLGDTYAMLGQLKSSILCYTKGLEVQIHALGDKDPRIGETCRYLAEAHVQAMELVEAERLCRIALDIHRKSCGPASLEEIVDRRLMALICDTKGDHEAALEHLVLASMAMVANNQEAEAAAVDASIGDTYLALARYEEAVFAYQKALTVFKTTKGENHPTVASIFVRLADLYNKTGKFRDSKSYCEHALRIYAKPLPGVSAEEIASGLTDISAIYESMNDTEKALALLQNALKIYKDASGQQRAIAGIEAQIGALHCMTGNFDESYVFLNNSIIKLRACGENKSAFFGIVLNQMGLACVQRYAINEAAELFEESRSILEQEYGPDHPETLGVYSNLAGTYDAMGRSDEAIEILEHVVGIREEKLGTANPDVDDEKRRLAVLLKEAGRPRSRRTKSLENLLDISSFFTKNNSIAA